MNKTRHTMNSAVYFKLNSGTLASTAHTSVVCPLG